MKNVLIISEDSEGVVDDTIHWLLYNGTMQFTRINSSDILEITDICLGNDGEASFTLLINSNIQVCSKDIHAYYYRRGILKFRNIYLNKASDISAKRFEAAHHYYYNEWEHILEYLHYLLKYAAIPSLNSFFDLQCNKITNLHLAREFGLNIPETLVSNAPASIRAFLNKHKQVITKPVRQPGFHYEEDDKNYSITQPTNIFTLSMLEEQLAAHKLFQPTKFQEYIDKEFEIRTFYLKGDTYSMAIFSQDDPQTQIDFRHYNYVKPNRNVPFTLPEEINEKIRLLMNRLNLDTGSLDFIYHDGCYTFLEVNTTGIFGWVSGYCNYYIEKEIANKLIELAYGNRD